MDCFLIKKSLNWADSSYSKIDKRISNVPGRPVIRNKGNEIENNSVLLCFYLKTIVLTMPNIPEHARHFSLRLNKICRVLVFVWCYCVAPTSTSQKDIGNIKMIF